MLILVLLNTTPLLRLFGRLRICRIIGIFSRNHKWKVGPPLFVVIWVSMVVPIERTILIDSVIHNGPRLTASFGQVRANFTIHSHPRALSENTYRFFRLLQLGYLSPLSVPTRGLGCNVGLLKGLHLWLHRIPQIRPPRCTIMMRT